jgi:uncharacterized protein YbcI
VAPIDGLIRPVGLGWLVSLADPPGGDSDVTRAISAAMVDLYFEFYGQRLTTATTYVNDSTVLCILEDILTEGENELVAAGHEAVVIDERVAFQTDTQDEFTAAIERITNRRVTAFLSANQTDPGVACELFFLDAPPSPAATEGDG